MPWVDAESKSSECPELMYERASEFGDTSHSLLGALYYGAVEDERSIPLAGTCVLLSVESVTEHAEYAEL